MCPMGGGKTDKVLFGGVAGRREGEIFTGGVILCKFEGGVILRARLRWVEQAKSQRRSENKLLAHKKLYVYHGRGKPSILTTAVSRGARTVDRCCLTCARAAGAVQNHTRTRTHAQRHTRPHTFLLPKGCKGSRLVLLLSAVSSNAANVGVLALCVRQLSESCKKVLEKCSVSAERAVEYRKVEVERHQMLRLTSDFFRCACIDHGHPPTN